MSSKLDKIDEKLDKILDRIGDHRERITRVETTQRGTLKIASALWVMLVSAVGFLFKRHWE